MLSVRIDYIYEARAMYTDGFRVKISIINIESLFHLYIIYKTGLLLLREMVQHRNLRETAAKYHYVDIQLRKKKK